MIGLNHGLTGALIAHSLPLPIALPLALTSHFILDALPHYGLPNKRRDKSRFWRLFFIGDGLATLALAIYSIYDRHYALFLGGLFGVVPDFLWVARVLRTRSFNLSINKSWFTVWHARIQTLERPWGLWIEVPMAVILFYIVMIRLW